MLNLIPTFRGIKLSNGWSAENKLFVGIFSERDVNYEYNFKSYTRQEKKSYNSSVRWVVEWIINILYRYHVRNIWHLYNFYYKYILVDLSPLVSVCKYFLQFLQFFTSCSTPAPLSIPSTNHNIYTWYLIVKLLKNYIISLISNCRKISSISQF